MKITILQRDIKWGDVAQNIARADVAIERNPGADLYLLPEMFSTGFCTQPEGIAESCDSDTLKWMKRKAMEIDAAIAGSVAVEQEGKYYNRFYFVKPDGSVTYYDKKHLFTYGGEHLRFTAGEERVVVEWRGVRILLEVCYDLRFPVWSRQRGDYDAIIYSALWPKARREVWRTLLRARAMENQAYVFGVNRIGAEPTLEYAGDSMAVDYRGDIMADCGSEATIAIVEIDLEKQEAFKERFDVARDADDFIITELQGL
jgi:predicted amidohydrolase